MEFIIAIGKRISQLRKQNGFSQAELARRIGCKRASVSAIEEARQKPPIDVLAKIVKEFGVSYDFIIDGINDDIVHSSYADKIDDQQSEINRLKITIDTLHDVIRNLSNDNKNVKQTIAELKGYVTNVGEISDPVEK